MKNKHEAPRNVLREGLRKFVFDGTVFNDFEEGGSEDRVKILRKLKVNEYLEEEVRYREGENKNNTQPLTRYLEKLKEAGLDIGHGNCEFGYQMPLPNPRDISRKLIIFRRREEKR